MNTTHKTLLATILFIITSIKNPSIHATSQKKTESNTPNTIVLYQENGPFIYSQSPSTASNNLQIKKVTPQQKLKDIPNNPAQTTNFIISFTPTFTKAEKALIKNQNNNTLYTNYSIAKKAHKQKTPTEKKQKNNPYTATIHTHNKNTTTTITINIYHAKKLQHIFLLEDIIKNTKEPIYIIINNTPLITIPANDLNTQINKNNNKPKKAPLKKPKINTNHRAENNIYTIQNLQHTPFTTTLYKKKLFPKNWLFIALFTLIILKGILHIIKPNTNFQTQKPQNHYPLPI